MPNSLNPNLKSYSLSEILYYRTYGRTSEPCQIPFPLFSNGYGIEVLTTGTELWIDIEVDYEIFEPWIFTEIDKSVMSRQMVTLGTNSICLYRGFADGKEKLAGFFRELQAMADDPKLKLLVKGFTTDGQFLPLPEKSCKIEFLGDSITSGEGTYGLDPNADWLPIYMSYSNDYTKIISDRLNADFHIISNGGYGVYTGWNNDIRHNIPAFYEKVCGISTGDTNKALGALSDYDFTWDADAIVINLGANDDIAFYNAPFTDPETGSVHKMRLLDDGKYHPEDIRKITDGVKSFLKLVRYHNPNAHIAWCFGMLDTDNNLDLYIRQAVKEYSSENSDSNVAYVALPATGDEEFGSRMHPGVVVHQKAAELIIEHLQKNILSNYDKDTH